MNKVKVLITDDSIFMRKLLSDLLEKHPRIEVIGTARNGIEAIEKIKELAPDVVTLDVEMPQMNGLQALEIIMRDHPIPTIMLSSTTSVGSMNTIIAMEKGAVDFVAKPSGPISLDIHKVKEELINKILLASESNISLFKHSDKRGREILSSPKNYSKIDLLEKPGKHLEALVCIGTSTGGPRALQTLLTVFPKSFPAPLFIVQHMPKQFTKSLADRLNSLCNITVLEAIHNQRVEMGTAYIAPGDYHMEVIKRAGSLYIHLHEAPPVRGHRPSVDTLFHSISNLGNYQKVAVILTGMGNDGTNGLKRLKEKGEKETLALAESEESCIVYGMPRAAIQTGMVDEVHHLKDMSNRINQYILS